MRDSFRLSRISHPRATLTAIILLAAVFIAFGVFADQALPDNGAADRVRTGVEIDPAWLNIQTLSKLWTA